MFFAHHVQFISHVNIEELWSTEFDSNFYVTVTLFTRFEFLAISMRFDNRETQNKRAVNNRLASRLQENYGMFLSKTVVGTVS